MTLKTFIFCDLCNPAGTRYVEQRRGVHRGDGGGRRISDGRAWFEGSLEQAVDRYGWVVDPDGRHLCPACVDRVDESAPGGRSA